VPAGSRIFTSPIGLDRPCGAPNLIQWVQGALSSRVKRKGREADYSPLISAEVKKTWMYTSTPPILLHGAVLNYLSTGTTFPFNFLLIESPHMWGLTFIHKHSFMETRLRNVAYVTMLQTLRIGIIYTLEY
jgi:hypothetical protein